jgi:hypothetical protein
LQLLLLLLGAKRRCAATGLLPLLLLLGAAEITAAVGQRCLLGSSLGGGHLPRADLQSTTDGRISKKKQWNRKSERETSFTKQNGYAKSPNTNLKWLTLTVTEMTRASTE